LLTVCCVEIQIVTKQYIYKYMTNSCCDLTWCNLVSYNYCNYSAILFVKIFHTFLDELNPTAFFIKINQKGCHYYRIDSIAERGTQNGWNDYSIYSFQFFEQIHFFLVCNNVIPSGFWKYYATFSIKISSLRDYAVPNVHPCSTWNPLKTIFCL
jgi:hypothetical protein